MKVGDVASLSYNGLSHYVVVSDFKWDDNPEKGTVKGIHYSLSGLLSTRVIIEEEFKVDLRRSKVNRVEFNTLCTYSPHEVVERAMKRVGEQKWNMSSNKSNNFCQWAKVKFEHEFEETNYSENETSGIKQSVRLSSLLVGKADVHLMNEIQPGDVVEYQSYKGIVIELENVKYGREFLMHIVIRNSCFEYYGQKVILRIDLNKDSLVVHRYHTVHCVSMSERVEKAIGMIGKKIQRWTRTGFIMDIILKERENN